MPDDSLQGQRASLIAEVEAERGASVRTALVFTLVQALLVVVGIAAGALAALAAATEFHKYVTAGLSLLPPLCIGLIQALKAPERVDWHRNKEIAFRGLLLRLKYEDADVKKVSTDFRSLEKRLEEDWQRRKEPPPKDDPSPKGLPPKKIGSAEE